MNSECIVDAGLDFDLPALKLNDTETPLGVAAKRSKGFYYKVRYKTIFGEQISFISTLVIDAAHPESIMMILRGTDKLVPKVCVGEGT